MSKEWTPWKRFWTFYFFALLIVCIVMLRSVVFPQQAASLYPDLGKFIKDNNLYANVPTIIKFALTHPLAWLIILFAVAPTISAILTSLLSGGWQGLKQLVSRLKPWRNGVSARHGIKIYGYFLIAYFVYTGLFLLITAIWGRTGEIAGSFKVLGGSLPLAIWILVRGLFIDEGATLEEIGWRGFGLPQLLDRMRNPLTASVLLGTLWWAWHFPREVPGLFAQGITGKFIFNQVQFLVLVVVLSIIITYMFIKTGGSALPAILIHGGTNVVSKTINGPVYGMLGFDLRTLILILIAIAILAIKGSRMGLPGREQAEIVPGKGLN